MNEITYTKQQILDFLCRQNSLKDAIKNIDNINYQTSKVLDKYSQKVLFYFNKDDDNLKNKIINYVYNEGYKLSNRENYMSLDALINKFNLEINY